LTCFLSKYFGRQKLKIIISIQIIFFNKLEFYNFNRSKIPKVASEQLFFVFFFRHIFHYCFINSIKNCFFTPILILCYFLGFFTKA
jgi:hypothetical protein